MGVLATDYQQYIDPAYVINEVGFEVVEFRDLYSDKYATSFDFCLAGDGIGQQEVVELDDGVILLFSDASPAPTGLAYQNITDSDWIHIQFRVEGEGYEELPDGQIIPTSSRSCIISRYQEDGVVKRETLVGERWRTACLFLKPEKIQQFFDIPISRLEKELRWLGDHGRHESRAVDLSLHPMALMAINDLFNCPLRNETRRAYMRAKSIELLSVVVHLLQQKIQTQSQGVALKLTANDIGIIDQAHSIISTELEQPLTLAALAKRVGVNRSKLAYGFKAIYGLSVQAYWRDIRLNHARNLLASGDVAVTQVAGMIGYADSSCFTRAFVRKFGVLPKNCRHISIRR